MDSLDLSATNVVGERAGATIALELAVKWPDRVLLLVLAGLLFWHNTEERLARLEQEKAGALGTYKVDGSNCTTAWGGRT